MENKLKVQYLPLDQLSPYEQNPKQHPPEQIQEIRNSIKAFGFVSPILAKDGVIVGGHGRWQASKGILEKVPVIDVSHLSEEKARALRISLNKICMSSGFDKEILAAELSELLDDSDMAIPGFSDQEIEVLFQDDLHIPNDTVAYIEQHGVVVECDDEDHQKKVFETLTGQGYQCKVVST